MGESRIENILEATIAGEPYTDDAQSRIEALLIKLKEVIESGGGGGTSDYTQLSNKPQINSIELTGDKSSSDLGLQDTISDLSTIRSNASAGAGAAAKVTGITETGNDYIKMGNGITLYISATQPQNPSEGDLWIGG